MKRNLSLLLAGMSILFLLNSCAKEMEASTAENYHFRAKFNGVEKTFLTKTTANKYFVNGRNVLSVVASLGNQTTQLSLWSKDDNFASGSSFGNSSEGCTMDNSMDYTNNQLSGHDNAYWGSVYLGGTLAEKFKCKLTEVKPAFIRGTFEADLYSRDLTNPSKIEVREGEFYVRLQ